MCFKNKARESSTIHFLYENFKSNLRPSDNTLIGISLSVVDVFAVNIKDGDSIDQSLRPRPRPCEKSAT